VAAAAFSYRVILSTMKRALCRSAGFALFFLTLLLFVAKSLYAADMPFYRELSLGSRGEDVRTLQKVLNKDDATKIRGVGEGSPGKETPYFGALTQDAVRRFQEKYRDEILTPVGLTRGTGFAGRRTLIVLVRIGGGEKVSQDARRIASDEIDISSKQGTTTGIERTETGSSNVNPNLKNLDIFLATLRSTLVEQGKTKKEIEIITEQIKKDVATTTNLMQAFEEVIKNGTVSNKKLSYSLFPPFFAWVAGFLKETLLPQETYAASLPKGVIPFGGRIVFTLNCSCSITWLILITPLPPSYVVLLSYVPGSQAYNWHNIPLTSWLLGFYVPKGVCSIYVPPAECYTFTTQGIITPFVGSSPTPVSK